MPRPVIGCPRYTYFFLETCFTKATHLRWFLNPNFLYPPLLHWFFSVSAGAGSDAPSSKAPESHAVPLYHLYPKFFLYFSQFVLE
jgi:hypothetical protein